MKFPSINASLDGVINYVTKKYKADLNIYIRTSNSSHTTIDSDKWGDSNALLDLGSTSGTSSCFCSEIEPFANVTIYFLKHLVLLKSYTITSRPIGSIDMLKSWNIYGSNNNHNWTYIDSKGPTNDLVVSQTKKTYDVDKPGMFKYFRITQTGPNSSGNNYFLLGKIEFFGELFNINNFCTSKQKLMTHSPFLYIITLIS